MGPIWVVFQSLHIWVMAWDAIHIKHHQTMAVSVKNV
jgi:hypothetical protein